MARKSVVLLAWTNSLRSVLVQIRCVAPRNDKDGYTNLVRHDVVALALVSEAVGFHTVDDFLQLLVRANVRQSEEPFSAVAESRTRHNNNS